MQVWNKCYTVVILLICVHTRTHMHMCTHTHVHACTHTHTHTHTHTLTHTHSHTHTLSLTVVADGRILKVVFATGNRTSSILPISPVIAEEIKVCSCSDFVRKTYLWIVKCWYYSCVRDTHEFSQENLSLIKTQQSSQLFSPSTIISPQD